MRIGLIGSSLGAMSLMLSTCGSAEQNAAQPANVTVPDQPQWSEANAGQLRAAIAHRATHGLDRMKFGSAADPGAPLDDAKLTELALTYAGALARGATDPSKLFAIYSLPRPQPDLRKGLADALKAGNVGVWIESLAPQGGNYRKLSAAYLALIKQGGGGAAAISPTDTLLKPGMSDPRVPAIAICLDGCEPAYLDEAIRAGLMPALVKIKERGTVRFAHSVIPSFTNPNNLSIVTGRPPAVHGISGNYFLDPDTGMVIHHDPEALLDLAREHLSDAAHAYGQPTDGTPPLVDILEVDAERLGRTDIYRDSFRVQSVREALEL